MPKQKYTSIPELLPAKLAAKAIGMDESTLRYHARRDQIGYYRIETGKQRMYLFTREDIARFLKGLEPIEQSQR